MKLLKWVFIALLLLGLALVGYWLKCQYDIDIIKGQHLVSYLPVQSLQKNPPAAAYSLVLSPGEMLSTSNKSDWSSIWARDKNSVAWDLSNGRLRVVSKSLQDWALSSAPMIEVSPGDVFTFHAKGSVEGVKVSLSLSVVLYDENKKVIQWRYGKQAIDSFGAPQNIAGRFLIPQGVGFIRLRLTGSGIGIGTIENIVFMSEKPAIVTDASFVLENERVKFCYLPRDGMIEVLDKRINKRWYATIKYPVKDVMRVSSRELLLVLFEPKKMQEYRVKVALAKDFPEIVWEILSEPKLDISQIEFPPVFETSDKAKYVFPRSEGFILEAKDLKKDFTKALHYGGGWPTPFLGVFDDNAGWLEIIETPDDFELFVSKEESPLFLNRWIGQKGELGYSRKIRYVFFDRSSYLELAKRFRQYAKDLGLLVSLKEKDSNRKNNITKLLGAVNVWYWGSDKARFIQELARAGINKCLFSNAQSRADVEKINASGYLSARYDSYQDVWPPIYDDVTSHHEGWPEDLVLDEKGQVVSGWVIKRGLKEYPGGVICSVPGLERARKRIPQELRGKPYTARFLDTTTSTPWRECYNPRHPTTRTEDLKNRMALLSFCSNDLGLVTGSEDGVADAIPYVDYLEGMMSPGIGRLPDSGREVASVKYIKPTENFLRYGVGELYRIPLWELVFHDCVVSTWYWGDSSNRIPELWWKKDLFNILYGNMPLWAIRDYAHWKQYKARFLECYNNVCPVFEKVGYLEMTDHKFVTEDHTIQETRFGEDIRIFVNFNETGEYLLQEFSYKLPAKGFVVFEKGKVWKQGVCT